MNEGKVEGAGSSKMAPTLLHAVAVGENGVMESKEGMMYHKREQKKNWTEDKGVVWRRSHGTIG